MTDTRTSTDILMEVMNECVEKDAAKILVVFVLDDDIWVKSNASYHEVIGMARYAQIRAEQVWKEPSL